MKPPIIATPTTPVGTSRTQAQVITDSAQSVADAQDIVQATEDRHHHAGVTLHGAGALYGLRASGTDLSVDISGGRLAAGGTYSESGSAIEAVTVADDTTTFIWVRGAAYTTEASTDATTLVFGTSAAAATPPSATYEWVLLAKVVTSGGVATVTNYPAGQTYCDWALGRYLRVYNGSGGAIARGDGVFMAATKQDTTELQLVPSVAIADGDDIAKLPLLGLACTDIANAAYGYVQWMGPFPEHPDPSAWTNGDDVWLGADGALVNVQPNHGGAYVGVYSTVPTGIETIWVGPLRTFGDQKGTAVTSFYLGAGADATIGLFANNADANKPGLRYYHTTSKWQYSNDGSAWNDMGTGGGAGTPCDSVTAETAFGASAAAGASAEYSRGDHTHGSPSLATAHPVTVQAGATAAEGTGTTAARDDHVHGVSTAATAAAFGVAGAEGTATSLARSDHGHLAFDTTAPANVSSAAAVGVATTAARRDHVHKGVYSVAKSGESALAGSVTLSPGSNVTLTQSGNDITIAATGAGTLADTVETETGWGGVAAAGAAATASRSDHKHGTQDKPDKSFTICVKASDTDVAVGDGLYGFCIGADFLDYLISDCTATVGTAGTTGTTDIQIRRRRGASGSGTDVDVLSTKLTIDSAERSSATAAAAHVIDAANDDLAEGDLVFVDVDAVSTTAPHGLSVSVVCSWAGPT